MAAYSFKRRFVEPILSGAKRQTIRADRRRHARPGETLQLYTGMRTKQCKLIARATCLDVRPVLLVFSDDADPDMEGVGVAGLVVPGLDQFAIDDGFGSWSEMRAFWRENHPGVDQFEGVLISWGSLAVQDADTANSP